MRPPADRTECDPSCAAEIDHHDRSEELRCLEEWQGFEHHLVRVDELNAPLHDELSCAPIGVEQDRRVFPIERGIAHDHRVAIAGLERVEDMGMRWQLEP